MFIAWSAGFKVKCLEFFYSRPRVYGLGLMFRDPSVMVQVGLQQTASIALSALSNKRGYEKGRSVNG